MQAVGCSPGTLHPSACVLPSCRALNCPWILTLLGFQRQGARFPHSRWSSGKHIWITLFCPYPTEQPRPLGPTGALDPSFPRWRAGANALRSSGAASVRVPQESKALGWFLSPGKVQNPHCTEAAGKAWEEWTDAQDRASWLPGTEAHREDAHGQVTGKPWKYNIIGWSN